MSCAGPVALVVVADADASVDYETPNASKREPSPHSPPPATAAVVKTVPSPIAVAATPGSKSVTAMDTLSLVSPSKPVSYTSNVTASAAESLALFHSNLSAAIGVHASKLPGNNAICLQVASVLKVYVFDPLFWRGYSDCFINTSPGD
jgi:hypothetical protein